MDVNGMVAASNAVPTTRTVVVKMTADINSYLQNMGVATQGTNKFVASLVQIDQGITRLKNSVGKALVTIGGLGQVHLTASVVEAARYEQAFANLAKTVNTKTLSSMSNLDSAVRDLSRNFPQSATEVANLAANVASLGVQGSDNIKNFTEAAIKLGATTDMAGDQAVGAITRMMQTFGEAPSKIEDVSGAVVKLANESNTSASNILQFATALQGVALQAKITMPQLIGLSAAITASGADSFAAATVTSRMIASMSRAVQIGTPELAQYGKVLGQTGEQFKAAFSKDAAATLVSFITAVGQAGGKGIPILHSLGLDDARSLKVMENIAHASGNINAKIQESQDLSTKGGGAYLTSTANKQFDTLFSQLKKFKNNIEDIFILMGRPFLKPLEQGLKAVNTVFSAVNGAIDKVLGYWHKLNDEINKVPVLKQAFGVFKEFVVILTAMVPALLMATGLVVLFASEILTLVFAIKAMKVVGPIMEGFLRGLLGMRAGGAVFKALDMLPFINGIDKAGVRTQLLAKMFAGLGALIRGTTVLTYQMVKALFIGSGPIDRMGIAFNNLLVPIRKVLNLIPGINFDPAKLSKQTANAGLIQRGFAAAFGAINTGWTAITSRMTGTWSSFVNTIKSANLFSAAMTQAQAFGAVLMAQAVKFKAAMSTVSSPIASMIGGMLSTMGSGVNSLMMKIQARRIPLGPSLQEASLAEEGAVGGAAGAGEAGLAGAGMLSGSLMGLGLAAGATALAMKHFQGEADKMVDAFDKAGAAADDLATSLGHPKQQLDLQNIAIPEGQPGYQPGANVPGAPVINDTDVLEIAKHAQTQSEKIRAIEGQYTQSALRSGTELSSDDFKEMFATGVKAGLSNSGLNELTTDIRKGARFFESGTFETSYVQALAKSASVAQQRMSNPFTDVSGSAETNLRAIADSVMTDVTQFGGKANYQRAVASIIQTYNTMNSTNNGDGRGELFHSFLDQIRGAFGKTGDKDNLSFSGGRRRITDLSGVYDWAKSNANTGGTQGAMANAILSQGGAFKAGNAAPFLGAATEYQSDVFRGFDAAKAAANVGKDNPYFKLISGAQFTGSTGATQGRMLGAITGKADITSLDQQKKSYQELFAARKRYIAQNSLFTADAIAQSPVVQSLDSELNKMSGTIDALSDKRLDKILLVQTAGQQLSTLHGALDVAKRKVEELRNEGGDVQLIDNAEARVTALNDKLTQVKSQATAELKQLRDIEYQQGKMDRDHLYNLQQAAKQEQKSMQELQYQFTQNLRQAKDQVAQFADPLNRLQEQQTASADDIIFNLAEQGKALSKYQNQLHSLHNMGLSTSAIKGLGLDDPKNYQQVDRLFHDVLLNPKMLESINREWGNRLNLSKALSTDKVRSQFRDMTREFAHSQQQIVYSYNQTVAAENRSYQQQAADISRNILDITDKTRTSLQTLLQQGLSSSNDIIRKYAEGIKQSLDDLNKDVTGENGSLHKLFKSLNKFFANLGTAIGGWLGGGTVSGLLGGLTVTPAPPGPGKHTLENPPPKHHAALGAIVRGSTYMEVGEAGPEAILPLNTHGADFLNKVMQRQSVSAQYRSPTSNVYNNSYDYSTKYSGAITVMADDPRAMEQALMQRQRLQRLRKPAGVVQ